MQNPLVTVVIPTYKRTNYLKLTLESILNQSFQDFEIIVVDDGSPTDDNLLLCNSYEKVLYFKIENSGGPAKPRNIGIQKAKGKYIAFVDDDDLWCVDKLEKQVAILEKNFDFGLAHGCCTIIDENGILQNEIIGRPGSPDVKHGDVAMKIMGNWTVMMPTSFIRKTIVDKVGFFNEEMPSAGEDMEYWVRCSFETQFYYIDEPLVKYRVHDQNISRINEKYIELPLYLKKVLDKVYQNGKINNTQYKKLRVNLCHMQIKSIKQNTWITLRNLNEIHPFWFLEKNCIKLLIKKSIE